MFDATKSRPRPINITLKNEHQVHSYIRKAFKLNTQNTYAGISISLDRIPKQIETTGISKRNLMTAKLKGRKI